MIVIKPLIQLYTHLMVNMVEDWEKYLESIYYDPKHSSPSKLYNIIKREKKFTITHKQLKTWLKSQETYTLHRPARIHFKRSKVMVARKNQQWDGDLMDFRTLAKFNDGYQYVLLLIDILTRYVWTYPLKNKTGPVVLEAFKQIFTTNLKPSVLFTDRGSEFVYSKLKKYLDLMGIKHWFSSNETKANYAERSIKTVKAKLYRYMTKHQTHRFIDVLPQITDSYNNTFHRTIKMTPSQALSKSDSSLRMQQFPPQTGKGKPFKFNVGDWIRLSYLKKPFDRDFHQKWTGEIFKITTRRMRQGEPVYTITDYAGDDVTGTFYEPEMQSVLVEENALYKIDKILRKRKRNGQIQYLVHWLLWPSKFYSWVTSADIESIKGKAKEKV